MALNSFKMVKLLKPERLGKACMYNNTIKPCSSSVFIHKILYSKKKLKKKKFFYCNFVILHKKTWASDFRLYF